MIKPDALWKGIIEDCFEEFLHFFYPVEAEEVDWSVAPIFMDKELAKLSQKSRTKGRTADKLVKVRLKNGRDRWILVHVEVQGYPDGTFPLRMYQMRIRIGENHGPDVVALAILTDDDPSFCPEFYEEKTWDNHLIYRWRSYKLLENPPETFADRGNIFWVVMAIAYRRLKKGRLRDQDLLDFKLELLAELSKRPMKPQKLGHLQNFIEMYVTFEKQEFTDTFERKLESINKNVPAMSVTELKIQEKTRQAMRKGRQEGRQEGLEISVERLLIKGDYSPEIIASLLPVTLETVLEIQNRLTAEGKLQPK